MTTPTANTAIRWTTTAEIPLGPWAQLVADVKVLLAAMAAAGARVTGPDGATAPRMGDSEVSFIVTAADRSPMPVRFTREPHDGEVRAASPLTIGLVLLMIGRATKHWGQLVTTTSDADATAWAVAAELSERLFGPGDRAVSGTPELAPAYRANRVLTRVDGVLQPQSLQQKWSLLDHLDALISALGDERDGVAIATQFAPTPEPTQEETP